MDFYAMLDQMVALLRQRGRASYRALKVQFQLDEEQLAALTEELCFAHPEVVEEEGRGLVWREPQAQSATPPPTRQGQAPASGLSTPLLERSSPEAERRQLTVLFCDLVGSTTLSEQLDPEELREVVQTYHATCAEAITRYAGYTAQHLGDGLLVYFGYPVAHDDEAARAVRTALDILAGLQSLNARLSPAIRAHLPHLLQVRVGIHTGVVVIGEIGSNEKREVLALGETPNMAARLQGLAEPDTVVISGATQQLVQGLFASQDLGAHRLKGLSTPAAVYRVTGESGAQSRFEAAVRTGLTPLVGREEELGLLRRRWEQAQQGAGQVVLLSGEPGIGKSRLVQELKEQLAHEGATHIEFHCSPYHQNSVLYPIIEHLQRLLQFTREDTPATKLGKLQRTLSQYRFPQADTVSLLATLLSLPHPEGHPPLTMSPQKQKQKIQEALVAWLVEEVEKAAVYCAWEDLHWIDPSTLGVLTLLLDQAPTTRLLVLLTFRPEFTPPWGNRSHLSQLTLSRLGHKQVEAMVGQVTGGKALPPEVVQQIIVKTDGVPLFVEELTKSVVESVEVPHAPLQPLAIPSTLQDSLRARLDRLGPAKEIAQLGATFGREFRYELLHVVSPLDEATLQQGLKQLVEAELVYQRGVVPQAHYFFKHALVQDIAYQSLLKSTRQQYHTQIAKVLEEQYPHTKETQPELLAQHYTEAGIVEQAILHWQSAGQRAVERSANAEAIRHLTKGLDLLKTLPSAADRDQHELTLQLALGTALQATKGMGAPETGATYARARELCHQMSETPRLFPVLFNLWLYSNSQGEYRAAAALARQLLNLAEQVQDAALFLEAHHATWTTAFGQGNLVLAREHLAQGHAIYHPQKHHAHAFLYGGHDPGVCGRGQAAWVLWMLGYPDQALERTRESLALAGELSHPMSLAIGLSFAANSHQFRGETQIVREHAEAVIAVCSEQGFPFHLAWGTIMRGWALMEQGRQDEGIAQMHHGLAAHRATGAELTREYFLGLLVAGYRDIGQPAEGLLVLAEALAVLDKNGQSMWEAELYRLKGELTLQAQVADPRSQVEEAEEHFLRAIETARHQQAKSLELRATVSLARLWQQHGKKEEAHEMLSEIYGWFTEGFETKDLQEAKVLLDELAEVH